MLSDNVLHITQMKFNNMITIIVCNRLYKYFKALINFLDGCASMLDAIAEYQSEMQAEYEAEMDWN